MMLYDFYWAAPLFTQAEKDFNARYVRKLEQCRYKVFLPQTFPQGTSTEIFHRNLKNLQRSNAVIAVCDGADADSGTSWECGYFFDKGNVFALRTDIRKSGDDPLTGINLMIAESATRVFVDPEYMVEWIAKNIRIGEY